MQCLVKSSMESSELLAGEKSSLEEAGYEVTGLLSEGSHSLVYSGQYLPPKPTGEVYHVPKVIPVRLALKVLSATGRPRDYTMKMLNREMTIHSRVSHPHIIHLHSILLVHEKVILATRLAERGTLLDHLVEFGELQEKQARRWFRQLALALSYLHGINIVHRDIKCENILITCNGNVKLADFGFSRSCADSKGLQIFSKTHCGSIAYAAPELITGAIYDPKPSDMWSLGVVLFAMLNACLPFPLGRIKELYNLQMTRSFRCRNKVITKVSTQFVNLLNGLLEPNWLKRLTPGQALGSQWIAMEPQLLQMVPAESGALLNTENFTVKNPIRIEKLIEDREKLAEKGNQ